MFLEEMYRGGLRTPNASQIQQITAHLSAYGRIEGKNVFYWFQNHKARDRQKLRRRLCMSQHLLTCAHQYYHGFLAATLPVAPPVTLPVAPPPYGVSFDQAAAGQLLAPTSPTPAAAAAAAAYGYYYPTAFAPASRCGGGATTPPSPHSQLFNYHHHQGEAGGIIAPAADSLGKLDNFGVAAALDDAAAADMAGPPGFDVAGPAAAFCRPLKTLDLFPGGIKQEEQHDVA
ncbi:hypothetical protein QOZ80_5AG0407010 [Eleusine coracana subsp. coracana]|nr:hypothetical protein QOZ80_5AG0407010 [Eleusine coracana subsp. coracana]